jgi:hypothetical protein
VLSRQQKKAAAALAINVDEPQSSLMGSVGPTPFKDMTNILPGGNSALISMIRAFQDNAIDTEIVGG